MVRKIVVIQKNVRIRVLNIRPRIQGNKETFVSVCIKEPGDEVRAVLENEEEI